MEVEEEVLKKPDSKLPLIPTRIAYSQLGLFARLVFSWVAPAMAASHTKALEPEDLIDLAENETSPHNKLPYTGRLMRDALLHYKWPLLLGVALSIPAGLLDFTVPGYILYLEDYMESNRSWKEGAISLLVVVALFLIKLYAWTQLMWVERKVLIRMTASINNLMYEKTMRVTASVSTGKTINLMQVDVGRIVEMIPFLPYVFSCVTTLIVAAAIMIPTAGPSSGLGFAAMLVMMLVNFFMAKCANTYNERMMDHKDERMKYTTELFTHIKMLKIYGWEEALLKRVVAIRKKEMHCLWMYMFTYCFLIFSLWSSPVVAAFVIFSSYTYLFDHEITVAMAFSTLSVLFLLQSPLRELPSCLSWILQAYTSSKRIDVIATQEFMRTEDVNDKRLQDGARGTVAFSEASFSYSETGDPVLKSISLDIKDGEFVAIVGKVGSGKSSMVNALLGELKTKGGTLAVNGSLAYTAALESWIQNASLKNNILFGKPFEPDKYQRTLQACALLSDLDLLPGGDNTEIGEKGINLSGGQKARVSLARAVYQDCDIYLLDDPLSSVDAHVGAHIFHQCFLGTLKGKTRILITHNTNFLNLVDRVIVMDSGAVIESGKLSELRTSVQVLTSENAHKTSDKETPSYESKAEVKLMDAEDREVGKVSWSVYLTYFRYAGGVCFLLMASTSMFLWMLFRFASDYTLKNWSENDGKKSNLTFMVPYMILGGIACVFIFIRALVISIAGVKAATSLHLSMLTRLIRAPINLYFDVTPLGRILNRLSKDTNDIDSDLAFSIGGTLVLVFSVIGSLCTSVFYLPWVVVVIPAVGVAGMWIQRNYLSMSRETTRLKRILKSPIVNHFTESLFGLKTIRCFKRQPEFQSKNVTIVDAHNKILLSGYGCEMWLNIRMDIVAVTYFAIAICVMLYSRDNLSTGSAAMMLAYLLPVSELLTGIMKDLASLENAMVCVERADSMSQYPLFSIVQEAATDLPIDETLKHWPAEGCLELRDVSLRYRATTQVVLKGLSAVIRGRERVGIAGRTGSGKSSLTLALFRIVELQRGHILIDGVDIQTVGLRALRRAMTMIPQDPVLFKGSLKYNLDPCELHSDEEIRNVLKEVGLPFEFDKEVTEGGTNFSVGERQLMCIARAGLASPRVLVLDEATSAIDHHTDSLIQDYVRTKFDCTVLTIAHRLHTILDSDRVMVMDQGRLVEFDAPQSLLADRDSAFFQLAQSLGYQTSS